MLEIIVPASERFDAKTNTFVDTKETTLVLEHSLISLSKWEAKYQKPFIGAKELTTEETLDYIRFMTITRNVPEEVYLNLSTENVTKITDYISSKQTATTFVEYGKKHSSDIITSEIIYYWMVTLNVPFECERWHINRLLTLIRVINEKNQPQKKISRGELLARQRELNAERRARLNTKG